MQALICYFNNLGLVVEDAVNGILSGKAAGAKVLAVCTSSDKEVAKAAGPDWIALLQNETSAKHTTSRSH